MVAYVIWVGCHIRECGQVGMLCLQSIFQNFKIFLSLSLSHTHTHTHNHLSSVGPFQTLPLHSKPDTLTQTHITITPFLNFLSHSFPLI